nr:hypothetical protein [Tanacetum cinerariifolium]
ARIASGGNTYDLAHLKKKRTRLRLYTKSFEETMHTEHRDGVADFKRRRLDFQSDEIMDLATASGLAATDDSLAIPEHTTVETPMNISPANKAYFEAEKEAIHLILTGIGDEIYSTIDAYQTA